MEEIRVQVHKWGVKNRVTFEPSKEFILIVHSSFGIGEDFKVLGCLFDVRLSMESAIEKVLNIIRPKVKALLRTRKIYKIEDMLHQFRTHIWGYIEYINGCINHATDTLLSKFDSVQNNFLSELGLSAELAFTKYNFAPIVSRHDIGLLGFVHKRVLGQCHEGVKELLPIRTPTIYDKHDKCIKVDMANVIYKHNIFQRSIFGTILIYNRLPPTLVKERSVQRFKSRLTEIARKRCTKNYQNWDKSFHSVSDLLKTLRISE